MGDDHHCEVCDGPAPDLLWSTCQICDQPAVIFFKQTTEKLMEHWKESSFGSRLIKTRGLQDPLVIDQLEQYLEVYRYTCFCQKCHDSIPMARKDAEGQTLLSKEEMEQHRMVEHIMSL